MRYFHYVCSDSTAIAEDGRRRGCGGLIFLQAPGMQPVVGRPDDQRPRPPARTRRRGVLRQTRIARVPERVRLSQISLSHRSARVRDSAPGAFEHSLPQSVIAPHLQSRARDAEAAPREKRASFTLCCPRFCTCTVKSISSGADDGYVRNSASMPGVSPVAVVRSRKRMWTPATRLSRGM